MQVLTKKSAYARRLINDAYVHVGNCYIVRHYNQLFYSNLQRHESKVLQQKDGDFTLPNCKLKMSFLFIL